VSRIGRRFAALRAEGRAAFVPFVMAADPDLATSETILAGLPTAGADLIEIGVMFSDPMADGPAIEAAGLRARDGGASVRNTLAMVRRFRAKDSDTPIVLMGYYNPIYIYGPAAFAKDAAAAGVDGLIVVDLPPEEDAELAPFARDAGLDLVRLATPTTDDARLPVVLGGASGFIYYVAIAGITGTRSATADAIAVAVTRLKRHTTLPVAVGFGIRTAAQAEAVAEVADAAVVGSSLVQKLAETLDAGGRATVRTVPDVLAFARDLAAGVRRARRGKAA